jgi:predicted peroxiredoxin
MQTQDCKIAVLDGKTLRKFINALKKSGADMYIDKPTLKCANMGETKILSCLKYSTGWDCRVHNDYVELLKSCL